MSESHGPSLGGRSAAALAAALALSAPGVALAQRQPQDPAVRPLYQETGATRYSTPDGAVRFVFDRSGGRAALVRFEGDPEVHVLRPVMGAGGGEIYRTEDGAVELRVTPHGGITVFTRAIRTGAPASEEGRVAPLTPEQVAFAEMQARFQQLQAQSRRRIGQTVMFTVPARMTAQEAGIVIDAAERAAQGLSAAPMTNVQQVIISIGPTPRVVLNGDRLFIQVAPQMGFAGRPSSIAIRNVVSGEVQGPEQ
ncbi:MAG: DUF4908 domain-containing protein [Hyphomonadaceae bacterium]|nr:DUF4908 domain-containing protein [Hyphomonadaceae bacterium]